MYTSVLLCINIVSNKPQVQYTECYYNRFRYAKDNATVRSNIILTIISSEKNIQLNLNRNRNLNIDCLQSYWLFVDSSIYRINFYTAKSRAVPNMSGLWKPLFCLFRADQNHWMYVISFWLCLLLSLLMLFFMYLKTCLTIFQVSVLRAHE